MYHVADSLDDLLQRVFRKLIRSKIRPEPSKGKNREKIGALLKLRNPRARFSRTEQRATLFTCLGETLWYFSGSDELNFIEHYIRDYRKFSDIPDDAETAEGAYGPRLFGTRGGINQVSRVIEMLNNPEKRHTRQAVIQVFDRSDLGNKDVPCTCNLQFFARENYLDLFATMRSNDAYLGLPHDVFAFTMLQELVARSIGYELGTYSHAVGSLHLYETDVPKAHDYLAEGWQEPIAMPPMPQGDPTGSLSWLLEAEEWIRHGKRALPPHDNIEGYWVDLARILLIKALYDDRRNVVSTDDPGFRAIVREKNAMASNVYDAFIRRKEKAVKAEEKHQRTLPGMNIKQSEGMVGIETKGTASGD